MLCAGIKSKAGLFCSETCIHGPSYLLSARNHCELLYWSFTMALAAAGIAALTGIAARIWVETPLEWTISEKGVLIEELPYPTVTVCAVEQVIQRRNIGTVSLVSFFRLTSTMSRQPCWIRLISGASGEMTRAVRGLWQSGKR